MSEEYVDPEVVEEPPKDEGESEEASVPVRSGPSAQAAASLKRGRRGTEFGNVNEALSYATACFRSGMLPDHIKTPQQAFVIMDNGAELGLRPWASWKLIYITKQGRISMQSRGALAVVQASPNFEDYEERIELEGTDEMRAVAVAKRKGRKPTIKSFSLDDARKAGLLEKPTNRRGESYDGTYQKFLKDMLQARARDRALNVAFAAELAGIELETMAEDADRIDADRAATPPAEKVQITAGKDEGIQGQPPKALPQGRPDPLLVQTLGGQVQQEAAKPVPNPPQNVPEPTGGVDGERGGEMPSPKEQEIASGVDEALGPPVGCDWPLSESSTCSLAVVPGTKRCERHARSKKVGDILHGTRMILSVDEDGRPVEVRKLTPEEKANLRPPLADAAPEQPNHHCPREGCGAPLNLLGDCDNCGWPTSNLMKGH